MKILYDLDSDPKDRKLIEKAAAEILKNSSAVGDEIYLKPLGRFGKTPARLYSFCLKTNNGDSVPFIAKLDSLKNIKREKENNHSVQIYFKLMPEIIAYEEEDGGVNRKEKRGILVFSSAGDQELKTTLDSCKKTLSSSSKDFDKKQIKEAIEVVEIALKDLPRPIKKPKDNIVENAFEDYLRHEVGIKNMRKYFKKADKIPGLTQVTWRRLDNKIGKFLKSKISLSKGLVHGDLHPSNIMVDSQNNGSVSLIDFAWASQHGVSAVDYAVMENSIHYMWAPFWLPEWFWETLDIYFLSELVVYDDKKEKKKFLQKLKNSVELENWGEAIWDIMSIIRKAAENNGITASELYSARAALLLGQAKFEDYAPPRIGAQLWRLLEKVVK
jgi:hypothetical protein